MYMYMYVNALNTEVLSAVFSDRELLCKRFH